MTKKNIKYIEISEKKNLKNFSEKKAAKVRVSKKKNQNTVKLDKKKLKNEKNPVLLTRIVNLRSVKRGPKVPILTKQNLKRLN